MYVTLGDSKTCLRVHGSGTVERWAENPKNTNNSHCRLTLTNVLHVPGIKHRFLSLSTFDDKGFGLHIQNHQITLAKGNASLVGYRVGKLYVAPLWQDKPKATTNQLNSVIAKPIPAKVWHERMGHLNWEALKAVKTSTDLSPLKGIVLADEPLPHSSTCPGCQAGKARRKTHPPSSTRMTRSTHPLERVHSDLVGPIPTTSINGHRYAVSFTCDYSNHVWSLPMKSKDQTLATFKVFNAQVKRQYGLNIRYFRSDHGGEFMSKDFSDYLESEGIIRETSAPDTPQQNGLAERMQQTIWAGIRAILHHSGMKNGFWAEALAVIVHVMNRAPRKRLDWQTPHEVLTGQVPNVAYLRTFGCRAWVHNHKGKKLDAKALPMTFIGYEFGSKAYRLWNPREHKVVISSDVTFDETSFPHRLVDKPVEPTKDLGLDVPRSEGKQVKFVDIPTFVFEPGDYDPTPVPRRRSKRKQGSGPAGSSPDKTGQVPQPADPPSPTLPPLPPTCSPTPAHIMWKDTYDDGSTDDEQEVQELIEDDDDEPPPEGPFPPKVDNLSVQTVPVASTSTSHSTPTPPSANISMPSSYNSPSPGSLHSTKSLEPETRRSTRKDPEMLNFIVTDDDQKAHDDAYAESVKLYISAATDRGEPTSYREATSPDNPDSPHWIAAVKAELKSLQDHGT